MPICTIHLLSLNVSIPQFLQTLSSTSIKPIVVSRVIRWIILPTSISTASLLANNIHWSILLILPTTSPLPPSLQSQIDHQFSIQAGVPSRLLADFHTKNKRLLKPEKGDIPPLTGSLDASRRKMASSSQNLELAPELLKWVDEYENATGGAVSMLNLLSFNPGLKSQYLKYGAAFAESIGSKRGGNAKIVGSVIHPEVKGDDGEGWDEIALAHYPSAKHFADMLASEDYQAVNHKYRVGSLKDTCILCTSEIGLEEGQGGLWRKGAGTDSKL